MQAIEHRGPADGRSWVVCNGEIYGFRELRRELETRGQPFHTRSDTEVILRAYAERGEQFIERIDGMFVIVVWDAAEGQLKLYRDRAGVKPLYYFFDGQRFAFASEPKALERVTRCRARRAWSLVREPDAGDLHVRFDERDVETE